MPFIERVEALVGLIWVMSIFIKIVIAYFTAVAGVSYIAKRDDYRPLLLPIGILIWAMANHLHPNIVDFTMFIVKNWTLYTIFGYFLILGIMLFGIIRKQDRHFRNDDTVRTGIVSIR